VIIQPAPAIQELSHEFNDYVERGRKLTEFEIKALEKKANALKDKINFSDYYAFRGIIAAFRRDAEGVTHNFENALRLAPTDTNILSDYLIALNNSGWYLKALTLGRTLAKKLTFDSLSLTEIVGSACSLGRFHEAYELLNKLPDPLQHHYHHVIIEAIDITDRAQLDDDETEQLQQLAFSILEDHKLYFSNSILEIVNDFIHYQIYVDLPIAQIPALDFELSLKFAEQLENMRDDVIVFEYKSVETLTR
jgi:tetratricopeptide (TPR) repeat protein